MIHVAAAVLEDAQGRILLTRRPEHVHQGGLWEFPGGKLEPGETIGHGLVRELAEELGVQVQGHRPLIQVRHDYGDKSVLLDVHRVTAYAGVPQGLEGQPLAWVAPEALGDYPMPAADVPIVAAVRLPPVYLFTPPAVPDPQRLLTELEAALEAGQRLVQLRVFDLPRAGHEALARRALKLCRAAGAWLLINADIELAAGVGADGVHLHARQLAALKARPEGFRWVAASCHEPGELARAAALGLDFAVLSPVLPTPSHPDAAPLGWEGFAAAVAAARLPVYALGGMRPELLATAWQHGAQGIAGIRGLWPVAAS
jgi:8-oxo-dGTP diphosphatase